MSGTAIAATQQTPFSGQVATVFDTNLKDTPASFSTVTINWGDGQTSPGQVVGPFALGFFLVIGNHTYAQPGSFPLLISVATASGANASATGTSNVAASPFPVSVNSVSGVPGQSLPAANIVATFLSPNATDTMPSQFSALIDWGDGQTTIGSIQGGPAAFTVTSPDGHTYAAAGQYAITVTVAAVDGPRSSATGQADIAAPSPYSPTSKPIVVPVSQVFSGTVATFTATNGVSSFTASIAWGDGSTTPATVMPDPNGGYDIVGAHTYTSPGPYMVTATVADPANNTFTVTDTATVTTNSLPGTSVPVMGGLAPVITNGPHAALGFTNTDRPTFSGKTAVPYSIVQLYARHFNVDAELPLGEAVADGNGNWTFTAGPMAVGTYIITATVTIPGGYPSNAVTLTNEIANANKNADLVYIDLTPRLVRWLSHGEKAVVRHPTIRGTHPRMPKPPGMGHHRA